MGRVQVETSIAAAPARAFDAARDIGLHVQTQADAGERAIAGVTTGLIGLGEEVTFEARHFGLRLRHRSRITVFEPPTRFVDEMVEGAFASFVHEHRFEPDPSLHPAGTRMIDTLELRAPLGWLGRLAEWLFLDAYLRRLLARRALDLKAYLEAEAASSA